MHWGNGNKISPAEETANSRRGMQGIVWGQEKSLNDHNQAASWGKQVSTGEKKIRGGGYDKGTGCPGKGFALKKGLETPSCVSFKNVRRGGTNQKKKEEAKYAAR